MLIIVMFLASLVSGVLLKTCTLIGFVYHAKLCMKLRSVQYLRVEHLCVHSELPVAYGVCLRRELMYSL